MASLETPFSYGISIFSRENEQISFGKIKISWKNVVPKLSLICISHEILITWHYIYYEIDKSSFITTKLYQSIAMILESAWNNVESN
jgi:hypothetical protein